MADSSYAVLMGGTGDSLLSASLSVALPRGVNVWPADSSFGFLATPGPSRLDSRFLSTDKAVRFSLKEEGFFSMPADPGFWRLLSPCREDLLPSAKRSPGGTAIKSYKNNFL